MTGKHDLMAALAAAKPRAFEPRDHPDQALRARDLAAILGAPTRPRHLTAVLRQAPVPRRRRAGTAGLAVATVALVAAALAIPILAPPEQAVRQGTGASAAGQQRRPSGAREYLLAAAHGARRLPTPGGAYHYEAIRTSEVRTFGTGGKLGSGPAYTVELSQVTRSWTGRSRSRSVTTRSQPRFLTDLDRANWRRSGAPALMVGAPPGKAAPPGPYVNDLDQPTTYPLGDESLTEEQLRRLPEDPARLAARLRAAVRTQLDRQHRPPAGGEPRTDAADQPPSAEALLFDAAAQLLSWPVTSAVRAAAFTIMAGVDGARLLGAVTDPVGRRGTGVAFPENRAGERVYVFDEATTRLLASQYVTRDPAAAGVRVPPGTAILTLVWVESGRTDNFGQTP